MEKRALVASLDSDDGEGAPGNIAVLFDADGVRLADIAWRPHMKDVYPPDGLLLC